jgi:hypothetical protein
MYAIRLISSSSRYISVVPACIPIPEVGVTRHNLGLICLARMTERQNGGAHGLISQVKNSVLKQEFRVDVNRKTVMVPLFILDRHQSIHSYSFNINVKIQNLSYIMPKYFYSIQPSQCARTYTGCHYTSDIG